MTDYDGTPYTCDQKREMIARDRAAGHGPNYVIPERYFARLQDDVLEALIDPYVVPGPNGPANVTGAAVSTVRRELSHYLLGKRWRNLPRPCDFEDFLVELGFDVAKGRNSRNQTATVVYLA